MKHAYVVDAVRSPRGRGKAGKGALSGLHPQELFAQTLNALAKRTGVREADVADVIVGCVSQVDEQGGNLARNAVLAAGWPDVVTGTTLNRFCASGLQAIHFGAMAIASGSEQVVVSGGVESMSRIPMGSDRAGQDGGNMRLRERVFQVPQGISADLIATLEGFTRADVDVVALRSQQKTAEAMKDGRFDRSVITIVDPKTGATLLARDEFPRPETTAAGLAKLEASFAALGMTAVGPAGETYDAIAQAAYPAAGTIQHVHTAGNSSGLADGAAAVLLASEEYAKAHGLKPRARIRAMATIGTEPLIMLTGPAPASEKALRMAGMSVNDVDLWEINEAFAAVVLQTIRTLSIDPDRVNLNGGAIALGHPLGATGAILLGTAIDELERRDRTTALITMCIGGGQGIATVIERV